MSALSANEELTIDFFLNLEATSDLSGKRADEATGYFIMLNSADLSLKIAILTEGAAIDYLFKEAPSGTRQSLRESISSSARLKNFIRVQTEPKQEHIVKFYLAVVSAMLTYHATVEKYDICWCCITEKAKRDLHRDIHIAYENLFRSLQS
jgi:hypothetical protein